MAYEEPRHRDAPYQKPDMDTELAAEVKDALLRQTESAGIDVQVSAIDGNVRLYGVVDVLSHKTAAERIAAQVPGVQSVINDLTVGNEGNFDDKELTEAITARITKFPELAGVGCDVNKGNVILVGHVANKGLAAQAIELAEGTPGARHVTTRLKVGEGEPEDERDLSRAAERMVEQMGLDPNQFEIYADDGRLWVKGFVKDDAERSRLVRMLGRLEGVHKVVPTLVTEAETGGEIH